MKVLTSLDTKCLCRYKAILAKIKSLTGLTRLMSPAHKECFNHITLRNESIFSHIFGYRYQRPWAECQRLSAISDVPVLQACPFILDTDEVRFCRSLHAYRSSSAGYRTTPSTAPQASNNNNPLICSASEKQKSNSFRSIILFVAYNCKFFPSF